MSESETKSNDTVLPASRRWALWSMYIVGLLLLNFGFIFTTMITVNYLERQPLEPLVFDFTLQRGDGGFIVYGVATAVLGFTLIWRAYRLRNVAKRS